MDRIGQVVFLIYVIIYVYQNRKDKYLSVWIYSIWEVVDGLVTERRSYVKII